MMVKVCHEAEVDIFSFQQGNALSSVIYFSHILDTYLAVKLDSSRSNMEGIMMAL